MPAKAATVQPELEVTQSTLVVHIMCTIFA